MRKYATCLLILFLSISSISCTPAEKGTSGSASATNTEALSDNKSETAKEEKPVKFDANKRLVKHREVSRRTSRQISRLHRNKT